MRLLLAALLSAACSTTPAIKVVATPNPVAGDGVTVVTVTATATEGGSPSQNAVVHFKTSLGTWDGATGAGDVIDQTTDDQGRAIATFKAPRQGFGTINIDSSFSAGGQEPRASTQVTLQPSGSLAAAISFSCVSHNVGAFVFNRQTSIHMLCTATAIDASNKAIKGASVQTLSEAGSLSWLSDQDGIQEFVYTVRPDDVPPRDVMPCDPASTANCKEQDSCPTACNADPFGSSCAGEPCWTDATGITHNPRDGVATLVAAVPAITGFDNQGEPFVDMNDNGVRDPGEPYIDYNGNGKYDPADGANHPHMVWKTFRVVWTGEATIPPAGNGANHFSKLVLDQANHRVTAHVFDRNLNALAADGASGSDGIAFSSGSCSGDANVTMTADVVAMSQYNPGILFVSDTGAISAPGNRGTYTQGIDISDGYTLAGTSGSCTVTATPQRTYDPGAPGFDSQGSNPDNGVAVLVGF